MCELLVAAFEAARPFAELAPVAAGLEELGVAGFGWGVAWLDERTGVVRGVKGLGRFRDEGHHDAALIAATSRRFVVHLRRPSRLSTVQMADTQPFVDAASGAWCHNGFLARAEELRPQFACRLRGCADSEVGWQYFCDRMSGGADPLDALRAVDEAFGGKMNLAYLGIDGDLCIYSRNSANRFWRFFLDGAEMAATGLHSDDDSLFVRLAPAASDRALLAPGTALRMAPASRPAAGLTFPGVPPPLC